MVLRAAQFDENDASHYCRVGASARRIRRKFREPFLTCVDAREIIVVQPVIRVFSNPFSEIRLAFANSPEMP